MYGNEDLFNYPNAMLSMKIMCSILDSHLTVKNFEILPTAETLRGNPLEKHQSPKIFGYFTGEWENLLLTFSIFKTICKSKFSSNGYNQYSFIHDLHHCWGLLQEKSSPYLLSSYICVLSFDRRGF